MDLNVLGSKNLGNVGSVPGFLVPGFLGFLVADDGCRGHLAGRVHPEKPERYDAVVEGLARAGLLGRMRRAEVRTATEDELLLCHTAEYLQTVRRDVESGRPYLLSLIHI